MLFFLSLKVCFSPFTWMLAHPHLDSYSMYCIILNVEKDNWIWENHIAFLWLSLLRFSNTYLELHFLRGNCVVQPCVTNPTCLTSIGSTCYLILRATHVSFSFDVFGLVGPEASLTPLPFVFLMSNIIDVPDSFFFNEFLIACNELKLPLWLSSMSFLAR